MYKDKKIHMIGISGVSMSATAEMLLSLGAIVSGSNINETDTTKAFQARGLSIGIGHNPSMIKDVDVVVYTAAISNEDPELVEAKRLNKEIYDRSEFLGELSKLYKNCFCISGTHGKSTTTGLTSLVFLEAMKNPTIQIGANLPAINSNVHIGGFDYFIMESCEYKDSFLNFFPTAAIITNIDNDHLDYFKNLDNIKKSFIKFAERVPQNGYLLVNSDDENSSILLNANTNIITYGINNKADYMAKNISYSDVGKPSYDVYFNNKYITSINLSIRGDHNIYNSLAVFALSSKYIDDLDAIKRGIEKYTGVGRRFEYIGKYNDAIVYDDYAHHPTEIKTTYEAVKKINYNENYAVFQPHTFSRTKEHLEEFAEILSKFDNIIIAPIFAAREVNTFGINEDMIVELIKKENKNVIYLDSYEKIEEHLKNIVKPQDVVITIGAGPINEVAKSITKKVD